MLRSNRTKSDAEIRFELIIMGVMLVSAAILYLVFRNTPYVGSMFLIPGLIFLGSAIFQDLQEGWRSGWLAYALAIILISTGVVNIVNAVTGGQVSAGVWVMILAVEVGAVFIAKAIYDPNIRN